VDREIYYRIGIQYTAADASSAPGVWMVWPVALEIIVDLLQVGWANLDCHSRRIQRCLEFKLLFFVIVCGCVSGISPKNPAI